MDLSSNSTRPLFLVCLFYCCCSVAKSCSTLSTLWTATHQASLSITSSQSLLRFMSIESMMPYSHLVLCCPFLPLLSIFPRFGVFSSELLLHIRWPKYCSFSISPSSEHSGMISFMMTGLVPLKSKVFPRVLSVSRLFFPNC